MSLKTLLTPDEPLADSLIVYRHTFKINEKNIANNCPDNGFDTGMRFVVALLSEVDLVPDSDVVGNLDTEPAGNPNGQCWLTTGTYKSAEDGA